MRIGAALAFAFASLALGGCPATQSEIRGASSTKEEFRSSKAPDVLAGCIQEAWNAGPLAIQRDRLSIANKTATGWSVVHRGDSWTIGLADITPAGSGSKVLYSSNFDYASKAGHIPGIRSCL